MSTFDIVVLVLVSLSVVYSFFKGMVREIFSLLAYAGGYFAATRFSEDVAGYMGEFMPNETIAGAIGFGLVFIGVSIAVAFLGKGVRRLMHSAGGLSGFDRMLGGILGAVKASFVLAVIMIPLVFFPDVDEKISRDSVVAPYLKKASVILRQNMFTGEEFRKGLSGVDLDGIKGKIKGAEDIKEGLSLLQKLKNLPGEITDKTRNLFSSKDSPHDEHPNESKKELEKMLRSFKKD